MDIFQNIINQLHTSVILKIWLIYHFEVLWACLSKLEHAHFKRLHKFVLLQMSTDIQKINVILSFPLSKILQSYSPRAFWAITHEQEFSQIWDLQWRTKNYKHLALFLVIKKNWASSTFRYETYLTPYKISGKTKFVILRKSVSNIYTYADRFICATKKSKLFYKSREDLKILFA